MILLAWNYFLLQGLVWLLLHFLCSRIETRTINRALTVSDWLTPKAQSETFFMFANSLRLLPLLCKTVGETVELIRSLLKKQNTESMLIYSKVMQSEQFIPNLKFL